MTDIQKLKALAEALPRKNWETAHANIGGRGWEVKAGIDQIAADLTEARAAFIAAANPAAVLELIAEIEALPENANVRAVMSLRADVKELSAKKNLADQAVIEIAAERDQLKAESEALRAEAEKWKNESVSDSQTIYSLSCNLAQRTGEVRELAGVVDDLSALTKRFVRRLRKAAPGNDLQEQALDYLKRKGLQGSAMREIVEGRLS